MLLDPMTACQKYRAMSLYFKGKFDYHRYGGKIPISQSEYENVRDRWLYEKAAKKYSAEDYHDLLVSNLFKNSNIYIRDLMQEDAHETMLDYQKRTQALSYTFTNDIDKILAYCEKEDIRFFDSIMVKDSTPHLLRLWYWKDINAETLIILNDMFGFFRNWTAKLEDPIIWPSHHENLDRYRKFLEYDQKKMANILKTKLKT